MTVRVAWLPTGYDRARVALEPLPTLAVEMPGARRTLTARHLVGGGESPVTRDVPRLALVSRAGEPGTLPGGTAGMWLLYAEVGARLAPYRLGNVWEHGEICWGGNSPRTPLAAWDTLWAAPWNADLWTWYKRHPEFCAPTGAAPAPIRHRCDPNGEDGCNCEVEHDCHEPHGHAHEDEHGAGCGPRECQDEDGVLKPGHGDDGHEVNPVTEWVAEIFYAPDGAAFFRDDSGVPWPSLRALRDAGRDEQRMFALTDRCACCAGECDCESGWNCLCCQNECDCHTDATCPCEDECECEPPDPADCPCYLGECSCSERSRAACRCDKPAAWAAHLAGYDPAAPGPENDGAERTTWAALLAGGVSEAGPGADALLCLDGPDAERVPWAVEGPAGPVALAWGARGPDGRWTAWRSWDRGVRGPVVDAGDLAPRPVPAREPRTVVAVTVTHRVDEEMPF